MSDQWILPAYIWLCLLGDLGPEVCLIKVLLAMVLCDMVLRKKCYIAESSTVTGCSHNLQDG